MATALEVDAAWHRVRDVSLQLGRWGRLDAQMLVEEHERGRVLVRIARRLRVTPFFGASAMCLLALALLLGTTMSATWVAVSTIGRDGRAGAARWRGRRRRRSRWPTA